MALIEILEFVVLWCAVNISQKMTVRMARTNATPRGFEGGLLGL